MYAVPAAPAARAAGFFTPRIEHATAADRCQQERELEALTEDGHVQIALGDRDRVARAEDHVVEDAAVLPQREFGVGAAVDVVEHRARHAALGHEPEIGDVDDARRVDGTRHRVRPISRSDAEERTRPSGQDVEEQHEQDRHHPTADNQDSPVEMPELLPAG